MPMSIKMIKASQGKGTMWAEKQLGLHPSPRWK